MTDLRITQMPAAATLTGAELLEFVQSGLNVQAPLSGLGAAVSYFSIQSNPFGTINNGLNNQFWWPATSPSIPGGAANSASGNGASSVMAGGYGQWQRTSGNLGATSYTGNAGSAGTTVQLAWYGTGGVGLQSAEIAPPVLFCTVTSPSQNAHMRGTSNGLPVSGFTMTLYFVLLQTGSGMSMFFGYSSAAFSLATSTVPSALLNSIGLARDGLSGENLQFIINNGSGSATKTDLGIQPTTLTNHLLRLVITCDAGGNCAIALTDLETGGLTYSTTYAASTAKLPANNTLVIPHLFVSNSGNTAQDIRMGIAHVFNTVGFGAI